jgi:hypothetical protein
MDFARFVQDYLNQKTEGDPSFMVSEESLAFVDLMRKDDMDRRASQVRQQTNANERGEQDQDSVTQEVKAEPASETGESAETNTDLFQQEQEVITTPAVPVSEVALGTEPLQASISDSEQAEAADLFQEDGNQPEPAALFTESGSDTEASQRTSDEGVDAEPAQQESSPELTSDPNPREASAELSAEAMQVFQESNELSPDSPPEQQSDATIDAEAVPAMFTESDETESNPSVTETGPDPASESATSEAGTNAEPPEIFTSTGQAAAPNSSLQEEGARVTEIVSSSSEVTIVAPEGMSDFDAMLRKFDSDYKAPDMPIGDDLEFPEIQEEPESGDLQNTSEFAETMMAGFTRDLLQFERRGT